MLGVLERFRTKKIDEDQAKARTYRETVRAIGDGEDVSEAALEQSGKSFDQLSADVSAYVRRKKLAEQVEAAARGEARMSEIAEEKAELHVKFEKAKQAFNAGISPLVSEEAQIRAAVVAGNNARLRLIETAGDLYADLAERADALKAKRLDVSPRRQSLTEHVARINQRIARLKHRIDEFDRSRERNGGLSESRHNELLDLKADLRHTESERDQVQKRLDEVNQEHEANERESAELQRLSLEP